MMPNMQNFYPTWLNASYYQNIPHNEVNWAQLAQQWMAMRSVESRFQSPLQPPPPHQLQQQQQAQIPPHQSLLVSHFPPHHQAPPLPPQPAEPPPPPPSTMMSAMPPRAPLFPAFESSNAPRFQRRFPPPNQEFNQFTNAGGHAPGLLPTPVFRPQQQKPPPPPQPQPQHVEFSNFNFHRPPATHVPPAAEHYHRLPSLIQPSSDDSYGLGGPFANQFQGNFDGSAFNSVDVDYRKWKPPLISGVEEPSYYGGNFECGGDDGSYVADEATMFDLQQRKLLPAWIREGLEKMERERQKQKEKEDKDDFLKEKQENKWKSLAKEGKSRFDDSDSDDENDSTEETNGARQTDIETANEDADNRGLSDREDEEEPSKSIEEQRAELTAKLRRWLTEILMEVTNSEIEKIVLQTHKAKLKRAQPKVLAQSSALATIKSLGVDYDDDDDEEEEEEEIAMDNVEIDASTADDEKTAAELFKRPLLPPSQTVFSKKKVTSNVGTSVEHTTKEKEPQPEKYDNTNNSKIKISKNNSSDSAEKKKESEKNGQKKKESRSRSKEKSSEHRHRSSNRHEHGHHKSSSSSSSYSSRKRKSRSRSKSREKTDSKKSSSKKSKRSSRSRSRSRSRERTRKR